MDNNDLSLSNQDDVVSEGKPYDEKTVTPKKGLTTGKVLLILFLISLIPAIGFMVSGNSEWAVLVVPLAYVTLIIGYLVVSLTLKMMDSGLKKHHSRTETNKKVDNEIEIAPIRALVTFSSCLMAFVSFMFLLLLIHRISAGVAFDGRNWVLSEIIMLFAITVVICLGIFGAAKFKTWVSRRINSTTSNSYILLCIVIDLLLLCSLCFAPW